VVRCTGHTNACIVPSPRLPNRPASFFTATGVYTTLVYTGNVVDRLKGFDWDAANVGHILRHEVTPVEVEETASRKHLIVPAKAIDGEHR
jgi:hypothetical protein